MSQRQKIIFFGNERLATGTTTSTPTLTALINNNYEVAAVIANNENALSRKTRKLEIKEAADAMHIPIMLPSKPIEVLDELKKIKADIGVLVAYGKIIPQALIDLFPLGIINIHPSLLPLHRGPTPIESAILHGDVSTGTTIMQLVRAMDAGPIYHQSELSLKGTESKQFLADCLLNVGSNMVVELLPRIFDGSVSPVAQDESKASYDTLINKNDGNIDWSKSAAQLEREVRAYAGWPNSSTKLADIEVIITEAFADQSKSISSKPGTIEIDHSQGILGVSTGSGTLWITKLKPYGKNEMPVQSFLRGYANRLKTTQ